MFKNSVRRREESMMDNVDNKTNGNIEVVKQITRTLLGRNVLSRDGREIIKVNTQPRKFAPIFYCMFGAYFKPAYMIQICFKNAFDCAPKMHQNMI
jgi:hypothetical protein